MDTPHRIENWTCRKSAQLRVGAKGIDESVDVYAALQGCTQDYQTIFEKARERVDYDFALNFFLTPGTPSSR